MNCIIIDDDELAVKTVKHSIERTDFLSLIGSAMNAKEGLSLLENNKDIDLVFLDIEMPEMTGFDLMKNFKTPQVILMTGKKEYAAEAFDYDVTDFILKPIDYTRFLKAAHKAKEIKESVKLSHNNNEYVFIKKDSRLIRLNLSDILYVEALADYVTIHTTKDRYTILSTMKSIENRLAFNDFSRIHRSYIIRLDKIREIEDETVSLGEKVLPISRTYKHDFLKKLNLF